MQTKDFNPILFLENTTGRKYPIDVRQFLIHLLETGKTVSFEALNYGPFEVMDFTHVEKYAKDMKGASYDEYLTNPYLVIKEIKEFIDECLPEGTFLKNTNVLPFARSSYGDGFRYIYFIDSDSKPVTLEINGINTPQVLGNSIAEFIDVDNVISQNGKSFNFNKQLRPEQLASKDRILTMDGEAADEVNDYERVIRSFLALTGEELQLNYFEGQEIAGVRKIKVKIKNVETILELEGNTGWIDHVNLIRQLNSLITPYTNGNRFFEFRGFHWGQEFGVVFGTEQEKSEFKRTGYLNHVSD